MFFINGNLGLHVVQKPSGKYGFVGSIPRELGSEVPATKSDVLGGRAYRDASGDLVTTRFPSFATKADAIAHAEKHGFSV